MIDREKVINHLNDCMETSSRWNTWAFVRKDIIKDALSLLKEQPEIVRCKNCKHATMTSDGKMCKYCAMDTDDFGDQREVYHDADWYCADGERRESE